MSEEYLRKLERQQTDRKTDKPNAQTLLIFVGKL